jgi:membrane protein DedA with SNARE-associated domain
MFPSSIILNLLTAAGLFAGLVASLEVWFWLGARARERRTEHPDQLANIQGAMLGLLALLLGFSFALAAGRFSDRVHLIVEEANAIGTAWLRCDLLPDADRNELKSLLTKYTAQRVAYYDAENQASQEVAITESEALHAGMWKVISSRAKAQPELANVLLPPFNELIDLHSARVAAAQRHMPFVLLLLLLGCSLVSVASVGYGCGVAGKRNVVLTTALCFLIGGTLWAIIDMDHPRKGLIRVGQQPMLDLQHSLGSSPKPAQ